MKFAWTCNKGWNRLKLLRMHLWFLVKPKLVCLPWKYLKKSQKKSIQPKKDWKKIQIKMNEVGYPNFSIVWIQTRKFSTDWLSTDGISNERNQFSYFTSRRYRRGRLNAKKCYARVRAPPTPQKTNFVHLTFHLSRLSLYLKKRIFHRKCHVLFIKESDAC